MARPTIPAINAAVTLDELRALTTAQQRYSKPLTQLFEDAANYWINHRDQYGAYQPQPLPTAARMGAQVVLSRETLEATDRIRAGRYSRANALYAAIRLWLDNDLPIPPRA